MITASSANNWCVTSKPKTTTGMPLLNTFFADSGALHVCYPNGEYDLTVITMLKTKGFKSWRSSGARGNHPVLIDKEFEIINRSFSKNTTLEQAKKWVDIGLEFGGSTFFQFHQITIDDTTSNAQENLYIMV